MKNTNLYMSVACAATFVMSSAANASQVIIENVFDYTGAGSAPGDVEASVFLPLIGSGVSDTETGTLGDGWDTTVALPAGALYTLTASMPDDGTYSVSGSGLVGLAGTVTTERVFSGTSLDAGKPYRFSLDSDTGSLVGLLSGLDIQIGSTDGVTDNVLVDTATGTGLLGAVDLLTLFGSSNTATFDFSGADFGSDDLYMKITTESLAGLAGEEVVLSGLSIVAVPEPSSTALLGLGGLGFMLRRRK